MLPTFLALGVLSARHPRPQLRS